MSRSVIFDVSQETIAKVADAMVDTKVITD